MRTRPRLFIGLLTTATAVFTVGWGGAVVAYASPDPSPSVPLTRVLPDRIQVGTEPFGVAVAPDSETVYVTNIGDNTVSVIDAETGTVVATVPVGFSPSGVEVAPDGAHIYVPNQGSGTVSVISAASNTVTATISGEESTPFATPYAVAITPDGGRVYVSNNQGTTVSVIDAATNTVTDNISVPGNPAGLAVSPNGQQLYVSRQSAGTVSVIDTATDTLSDTVTVGGQPAGVAVSPDGQHVYVTNQDTGSMSVIDTSTDAVSTVGIGNSASWVGMAPDGGYVYAGTLSGSVAVIDASTNTVAKTLPFESSVYAVAVAPDGQHAYVPDFAGGSLAVLAVPDAPGAPSGVSATAGADSALVSWTAPVSDGGSAITGYEVTATDTTNSENGGQTATAGAEASSATVSGLTRGDWYTFTVVATNAVDDSRPSEASDAVVAADRPGTPGAVTAVAGDGSAVVSWPAPVSDGGSPITGYTVTWFPPSGSQVCVSSPCTVTGLTNGTSYMFEVVATNVKGDSGGTALSNAVTPTHSAGNGNGNGSNGSGNGSSNGSGSSASGAGWFQDPLSKAKRHQLAPARPGREGGKAVKTKAAFRTHNGTLAVPAGKARGYQLTKDEGVQLTGLFRFDSAQLTAKGRHKLAKLARSIKNVRAFTCEGYADYAGSTGHEQRLSVRRAQAVCAVLTHRHQHGRVVGYGPTRPVVVGGTAQGRADNRRVDLFIRH